MRTPHDIRRRRVLAFLGLLLLVGGTFMLRWLQRSLLFPRSMAVATNEAVLADAPGAERWWHTMEDGEVEAWFLPGVGVDPDHPGPAVVCAHGNGEVIDQWVLPLRRYREWGLSVLLLEYRGYGRSAGTPS